MAIKERWGWSRTGMTGTAKKSHRNQFRDFEVREVVWPVLLWLLALVVVFSVLPGALKLLPAGDSAPELSLPVLLVFGTAALLLSVASILIISAMLGLTNYREALGLPQGSVRAIIALLLIVLFFITAVFLYADLSRSGELRELDEVSAARLALIPTNEILGIDKTSGEGADAVYSVMLASPPSSASVDLAKQLVTTVGTLVVSIAAFYFGSTSVQSAYKTQADASKADDSDRIEDQAKGAGAPTVVMKEEVDGATTQSATPVDLSGMNLGDIEDLATVAHASQPVPGVTILSEPPDPTTLVDQPLGAESDHEPPDYPTEKSSSASAPPTTSPPGESGVEEIDNDEDGGSGDDPEQGQV